MTTLIGTPSSWDFTVGIKIDIDELIYFGDPLDTPLLTGVGADGLSVLGTLPTDQVKYSWLNEEGLTPRAALTAAQLATDTTISVGATNQARFAVGDILAIVGKDEILRVTAYSGAASLTVERSFGDEAAVALAVGDIVYSIGYALPEGSAPGDSRQRDRTDDWNCTQIFGPESVAITRTEQSRSKYGVSDEFAHQLMRRLDELNLRREFALVYGRRIYNETSNLRTMGGMKHFITAGGVVDSASTTLTVAAIESMMASMYDAGGLADRLMAKPSAFANLNSAHDGILETTIDEARRGVVRAEYVNTEYGSVTLVRNRWMEGRDAALFRREGCIRRPFDPVLIEPLAKTRDAQELMIVCEEGLEVKGAQHMGWFNALSYSTSV